jgi:YD repeat-containing protein
MKKIKSIKRYNQSYKNFSFSDPTSHAEDEFMELEVAMDLNGNATQEIKYTQDGEIEEKNSYSFNEKGKLLSHELMYVLDDVTEKRVLTRNEKGFLVKEVKYYGSDSGESTIYEYNDKDNVVAIVHYDEEGNFVTREEISYDEKDNVSMRAVYDEKKNLQSKTTFTSTDRKTIEEYEYDSKEALVSKTVIRFNDLDKEESSVQTNPQGKLITAITNKFDDRGNVIEKVYKDFHSKTVRYDYDDNNRLISQELFDDSGLLLRKNLYEYDDDGNVVAEQNYEMDTTRGGRDKHYGTRYEYEFFE